MTNDYKQSMAMRILSFIDKVGNADESEILKAFRKNDGELFNEEKFYRTFYNLLNMGMISEEGQILISEDGEGVELLQIRLNGNYEWMKENVEEIVTLFN